jgi:hypothetical protein
MATTKVTTGGITDATVSTADIADQAVTLAKLEHGTSSTDGKFLRANNGADPTWETVNTDLVSDTSPQLGGDLDTNSFHIYIDDGHAIRWGANNDLEIYHDGNTTNYIDAKGQTLNIDSNDLNLRADNGERYLQGITNGSISLYHNNSKKFETVSNGVQVAGFVEAMSGDHLQFNTASAHNIQFRTNGTLRLILDTSGHLTPYLNNTYTLGTSSNKFSQVHATTFHGDGSNLTGVEGVPSGVIAMWSGATANIPSGWVICDGNNSTPDLRDKFVVGASAGTGDSAYPGVNPGSTGGSQSGTIAVAVNGNTGWAAQYANASSSPSMSPEPFNSRDRHQHGWGGTFPHSYDKMPPYYALAFIMKT